MEQLIDAFYSRFLLRDVFGKIVPGAILIFTLAVAATSFQEITCIGGNANLRCLTEDLALAAWVALIGVSWTVAFAIQRFGEVVGFLRYFPKTRTLKDWYDLNVRFRNSPTSKNHLIGFERITVIKEACGNTYVSLFLASWYWLIFSPVLDGLGQRVLIGILDAAIIVFLA